VRVVVFAALITPDFAVHPGRITSSEGLVFTSPDGKPLRHNNFRRRVWLPALELVGLLGVRFNDLRHTGNKLTSDAGANLREMMARMGHDSARAALIYQPGSTSTLVLH
jgi:integrase